MIKILKKTKYILTIICIILLTIYIHNLKLILKDQQHNYINEDEDSVINDKQLEVKTQNNTIQVDIKGAVKKPMVYEVEEGSRVIDLINISGGLLDNADTSLINLSKVLTDEMVIYIYTKEEVKNSNIVDTVIKVVEKECVCPNIQNDGCINTNINGTISNSSNDSSNNGLININTASLQELMTLPGIGEQKAQAIIDYRNENGNFNDISDITKVSGIGNSLYETIKAYITT